MNFEEKEVEYVDHEDPRFNYTSTVVVVKDKDPTCHLSGSKYPVTGTYSLDQLTELAREIRSTRLVGVKERVVAFRNVRQERLWIKYLNLLIKTEANYSLLSS